MKKRVLSFVMLAMLVLTMAAQASDIKYVSNAPVLTIKGTTATCSGEYTAGSSDSVKLTLTLWCGENIVKSWTSSGTGSVSMSKTCKVVSGNTYKLVMMPVVNGVAQTTKSTTATS